MASCTVSLLQHGVIAGLDPHRHGLGIVPRHCGNSLPLPDGRHLLAGLGRTHAQVAKFSSKDAARLPGYERRLDAMADVLRALALQSPPNVTGEGWCKAAPELLRAGRAGRALTGLALPLGQELLDLFTLSACEYLDRRFDRAPVKSLFGFDGIVGHCASPYAPGTACVLLHHVSGESNRVKGVCPAFTCVAPARIRAAGAAVRAAATPRG